MIKYNVGSGPRNFGPDWAHIDGAEFDHTSGKDVSLKYQPDNYIDLLYSSHLIAYFSRDEVVTLLKSWYRKIKPGGILRIATPDFSMMSNLYHCGTISLDQILGPLYGKMPMGGEFIYHKTTFDMDALTVLLEEAGFINVHRYDHTKTEHPHSGNKEDQFSDCSGATINKTLISLNIECEKPR